MEDTSVEVDCTLPEEPVRDSRGVGRTSQLDIQSQNYAFMHFHLQLKGSRHNSMLYSVLLFKRDVK